LSILVVSFLGYRFSRMCVEVLHYSLGTCPAKVS